MVENKNTITTYENNETTSHKRSTFLSGKYVGCYAPIGYMKSPKDKHILIPDPVTAPIVRHIFDLRLQGYGFRKIAMTLNEEKVPTPSDIYYMAEERQNLRGENPHWNDVTVKTILRNEVYIGHTVQNKTGNVSYKIHKQVEKPKDEWICVENTHEPLISQETWDFVCKLDEKNVKNRTNNSGTTALFSGLLYCADCGSQMRFYKDGRKRKDGTPSEYKSYACGRYATAGKTVCTAHILNQRVISDMKSVIIW